MEMPTYKVEICLPQLRWRSPLRRAGHNLIVPPTLQQRWEVQMFQSRLDGKDAWMESREEWRDVPVVGA